MWLIPIERGHRATVHLRSGAELRFRGRNVTSKEIGDNLVELGAEAARGTFPFYIRLGDVSAIETRRTLIYRPLHRIEWLGWAVVLIALLIWMATRGA